MTLAETETQEVVRGLAVINRFMQAYENLGQQTLGVRERNRLKLKWQRAGLPRPARRIVSGARPYLRCLHMGVTAIARLGRRPKDYGAAEQTTDTEVHNGTTEDCVKTTIKRAQNNATDNLSGGGKRWKRLALNSKQMGETCRADKEHF